MNFLFNNRFLILALALVYISVSFVFQTIDKTKLEKENAELKNQTFILETQKTLLKSDVNSLKTKLDEQNNKLLELSVKVNKAPVISKVDKALAKTVVPKKDESCEKRLKFYETLFEELSR